MNIITLEKKIILNKMKQIKWLAYRCLVALVGTSKSVLTFRLPKTEKIRTNSTFNWVFCSTIGELNGCKPLIQLLASQKPLLLITDRDCYAGSFHLHFPDAVIVELQGWEGESAALAKQFPPEQLVLCEIPCKPNDAPCRLSYGFLRSLKKQDVPIYMVNGWLYEYQVSCRQDAIERRLFTVEYLALFDKFMVQTAEVKDKLIRSGAQEQNVHITGNMKFDAVHDTRVYFKDDNAERLIVGLSNDKRLRMVAGSVSEVWEYELLAKSFVQLIKHNPNSLMIMAPRHPEKQEQLEQIENILRDLGLSFIYRSELTGEMPIEKQVLILDTFGELRGMYSVCDFAYIGRNHNVLEPLAFGKPVVILDGWEATYPSYPVYEISKQHNLLVELNDYNKLGTTLIQLAQQDATEYADKIESTLSGLATALQRNMTIMEISGNES